MKTITIDYSLYNEELSSRYEAGQDSFARVLREEFPGLKPACDEAVDFEALKKFLTTYLEEAGL